MKKKNETTKLLATFGMGMAGAVAVGGCSDNATGDGTKGITPVKNGDGNYNIVLILTDQERYFSEYPAGTSFKGRERLKEIGMTFNSHYACSNVSTASRSCIYTGRHITETRMMDNTNYPMQPDLDTGLPTIGDMLRQAGYYTAYKGKWHLSGTTGLEALGYSLEEYGFSDWGCSEDRHGAFQEGYEEDGNIADEACAWINSVGLEKNAGGQSFFLAVNFINPHDIMYFNSTGSTSQLTTGGAPASDVYAKTYSLPAASTWNEAMDAPGRVAAHGEYSGLWDKMTGQRPQSEEEWQVFQDYYLNCIQDCDNQLVTLLDSIENKGLLSNTIIIFSSDHGEMMGAHGLKGKAGFMYEDNIHVPFIVYHPDYAGSGGRSCSSITSHLDVAPTLLDMTNSPDKAEIASELKGKSMLPLLADPSLPHRNVTGALFAFDMLTMIDSKTHVGTDGRYKIRMSNRGFLRGIVTGDYKFARYFSPKGFNTPTTMESLYANNDVEMFAMGSDETQNIAWSDNIQGDAAAQTLVMNYNALLNSLISAEIGVDDGRETESFTGGLDAYAETE